jgi:two-component system sensor histidine kinase BaeS
MNIRIQYKLFLAILATAIGIVVCMFLVMRWSLERGFLNYVNELDLERLNALATKLEESYSREGSWRFLQDDPRRWSQLLRDSLPERFKGSLPPAMPEGRSPEEKESVSWHRKPPEGMDPAFPPPPGPPEIGPPFGSRVVLLDEGENRILGPSDFRRNLELKPLRHGSKAVGYLGMLPPKILSDTHQSRFVEEQKQTFAIIALAMVVLAAVVSIPLAQRIVKRIRDLASATHRFAAGKYDIRIPVTSSDELGQLARDFNILALTLEKNEQARRHWVADISHELRTPLSVLRGEIEALQDGVRAVTPEAIGALHGEVMKLSRLVHDLYELSLSDIGALRYRMTDIDLGEVLKQALESVRPEFADKNISLEEDLPVGQGFPMFADPDRLHQLFSNLLENSLKYTDSGGRVRVRIERQGTIATVHFQDSAPGVPETETGKLFDRLYRVEGSRNRDTGGAGLGLSICRNIVEAHKGTTEALPSPLGGLWVKVELPLNG